MKKKLPEVYSGEELDAIEKHINEHFGPFSNVFHELVSPDIHVDICIIEPNEKQNYITLVTMGMGAHSMKVPRELKGKGFNRAEIVATLPKGWPLQNDDEQWYWPLRWMKILARLPGEEKTWLGWGHTVPNGEPFSPNTELSGVMLSEPNFDEECRVCVLPGGEKVNFYQMVPLYENEMNYKIQNGAEALEHLYPEGFDKVIDVNRNNFISEKKWFIKPSEIKELIKWKGPEGCFATDRIMVDGCKVGYMYREEPDEGVPDSGWRFTAGDESDEYMDNPDNSGIYALNTVANSDPDIIPFLKAPYGSSFIRDDDGMLKEDEFDDTDDDD